MQFHPYTTFIIHVPKPVFVYDEVWLHELVPQHACCANFNLNLSLDESTLFEPISNNPSANTQTCTNIILQHVEEEDTTHVPKPTCSPQPPLSNNCTENNKPKNSKHDPFTHLSEKELCAKLFTTLSKRKRGRVKKTYRVEFTEHIFSKLYNGKVKNHQGCKVKNKLIPIVKKHDT